MTRPRIHSLGDAALVCEAAPPATLDCQRRIWALAERARLMPHVVEVVPGMNNLTIVFDPLVADYEKLAAELEIFIPTSFFEADGPHFYNSLAMIDDKGAVMGGYRKSHIPDGPGYSEKYYFRPGNSGFKTWPTPAATLGLSSDSDPDPDSLRAAGSSARRGRRTRLCPASRTARRWMRSRVCAATSTSG